MEGKENIKVRKNLIGELKQATGSPICIQACPRIILLMKTNVRPTPALEMESQNLYLLCISKISFQLSLKS